MKEVLMVIPFEQVYPPMNGGMLRCFNVLHQLCRHFRVTVIMQQDKASFAQAMQHYPALKQCTIISTKDYPPLRPLPLLSPGISNALRCRWWNRSLFTPTRTLFLELYPLVKQWLSVHRAQAVILEDMAILDLAKLVYRYQPGIPVIYDAYNVNSVLAEAAFNNKEINAGQLESLRREESSIYKKTKWVFACSENDLVQLNRMNGGQLKGAVVPNGVQIPEQEPGHPAESKQPESLLFCASMDYLPNKEGLAWFLEKVFPLILQQLPHARLLTVGRGDPGEALIKLMQHPSIDNFGKVPSVVPFYQKASVAIVPLLSGSGTRLKLLEAMAYDAPVISTSIGAEGIAYTHGDNIMIADDPEQFAASTVALLKDNAAARKMAQAAFSFVQQHYDWNIIGNNMAAFLNTAI